jgi:hypothetical protein
MQSVIVSSAVGLLAFAMGLVGLYLRQRLPERHMSMGSRDMIGAIMGLLSLLLALVLGILVGSAHEFFASQKAELESLGARSLELELAFRQYGPETEPLQQMMKASVQEAYEAAQGIAKAYEQHFEIEDYLTKFEKWNDMVASLVPHTPQQTELLSSIRSISASFQQTRLLMSEQLASSISWPLLVIVVAWALLLFCGFGVMSGLNPTSIVALGLGAHSQWRPRSFSFSSSTGRSPVSYTFRRCRSRQP